ncbi:MAG TPA: DUF488 domain-containing protein [Acidimicrobiales bacterium]|nr:DUF488 domain-containing protein [Acidimicrobiales bacterium]
MRLLTVGHGTLPATELVGLLEGAGVTLLVDVRSAPGSRRHPHLARDQMGRWLPEAGIHYRWEPALGGRRKTRTGSPNTALRHPAFRGYADHMAGPEFTPALDRLLDESAAQTTAAMCAETLWWRCHRRLLSDAAVLLRGAAVVHLDHRGQLHEHRLTDGVRVVGQLLQYDVGSPPPLPGI